MAPDQITTETGGTVSIDYSEGDCAPGDMPAGPAVNQRRCFPVYWSQVTGAPPTVNWFHKYVVESVTESGTGGTVDHPITTSYTYMGGGAWHYDDNELVKPKYTHLGPVAGLRDHRCPYGQPVRGGHSAHLRHRYLYMRGMDGDRLPDGPDDGTDPDRRVATVTTAEEETIDDLTHYQGFLREHIQRDGEDGPLVAAEVNDPWRSEVTADDGTDTARIVRVGGTDTRQQKAGGGFIRTRTSTSFDQDGLSVAVDDQGDTSVANDSVCTLTDYGRNTSRWLLTTVKRSTVVAADCDAYPNGPVGVDDDQIVSDVRYSFDQHAYGEDPSRGDVTTEETLSGMPGAGAWRTTSTTEYDDRGRVTSSTDGEGNTFTTTYTPTGADPGTTGPVTKTVDENAKHQTTTTWFDTARGLPVRSTDPNGKVTSTGYDPLGRVTAVWKPGRTQGVDSPHLRYTYALNNLDHHSYVRTDRLLGDGSSYATSYVIYDEMLRQVQTQDPSARSAQDKVLTVTHYNALGQVSQQLGAYQVTGATPTGSYGVPNESQVMDNHRFIYDGAGRQTADIYQPKNVEAWRTTTTYDADRTIVDPPSGGTPTTEVFDVRGNRTELWQHLGTSPTGTPRKTTYAHNAAGQMTSMKDPAGNLWIWTYDLRGNQVRSADPDTGTTTTTYDNEDRPQVVTDSRATSTYTAYDELGRKTALYGGTSPSLSKLRAQWVYDTVAAGQLTKSIRYQTPPTTPDDISTAFVQEVTGYNDLYQPTGTKTTVPSINGVTTTAAGDVAGTYQSAMTYRPDGTLRSKSVPTAPGLPSETLTYTYNWLGMPYKLGGYRSVVVDGIYSPYGEPSQLTLGSTSGVFTYQTWFYDEGTRRLNQFYVSNQNLSGYQLDNSYGYDQSGNVTRVADVAGADDIQCFTYDYQRQLKHALSMASGACGTATETVMGGPAPYWSTYSYDTVGNRTSWVEHKKAADNVTSTYSYPAAGALRPHAVTQVSRKVGSGDPTDTGYGYDAAGNTTTRGGQTYTWDGEGPCRPPD